ncbi:MAG: sigma-54 dependent transcriptional regulator [Myxococcota bacterium]
MAEGTILIVEDEQNMRRVIRALLKREGYQVREAPDGARALEDGDFESLDVVVTDLKMPHMNGLELLHELRSRDPRLPVVLLTAFGTIGSAVEALKQGALDYLTKPFDPTELLQIVAKGVDLRRRQSLQLTVEPDEDPEALLEGSSPAIAEVRRLLECAAPTAVTVLLTGESGTGKELVARALQRRSAQQAGPFLKINCAAIPEPLFESELFGYERGAFTGAGERKPGRFELAQDGTLFLDEIGEIPPSVQPKLLRALQDGTFFRVGGVEIVEVQVRLIAATNRDLRAEIEAGRFREDLYYRLNVLPIHLPSLRERVEDIPALADFFLRRIRRKHGKDVRGFEPNAIDSLICHPWPGNLRQLENAVERAVLLSPTERIGLADLPTEISSGGQPPGSNAGTPLRDRIREATRTLERDAIVQALAQTTGNVTRAARTLGMSRRGLQLKMKELGIR